MYSTDMSTVSLREFQKFLLVEQNDSMGNDEEKVAEFMREYLRDPNKSDLAFEQSEFLEMLYSKRNSIWDSKYDQVTQDMNRPLSHYWISTSHNTFLKGDENSSELSLDGYAHCLRTGCRCINLECWDGPDGVPVICHSHTVATRLNLLDVLYTIKDNAFAKSDYPLILSIESNCSVLQQRNLAQALLSVFGDLLHTNSPSNTREMISTPFLLRGKVLLKHNKLQEKNTQANEDKPFSLGAIKKCGVLYMETPSENQNPGRIPCLSEWFAHKVNLTLGKMLHYEQCTKTEIRSFRGSKDLLMETAVEVPQDGTHFGESWFHGKLDGNREEAERLLHQHSYLGDGTFLVRQSSTYEGDYCLSFLRQGKVGHCRIQQKREGRNAKYFYDDELCFDSLYELVTYYRRNPIDTEEFLVHLKVPVPRVNKHESKAWYHPRATREQAEKILKDSLTNGAFLVRPGESDRDTFVITFRYNDEVKHCKIYVDHRMYTFGTVLFESLVGLVDFYQTFNIYHKTKLTQPIQYVKTITANAIFEFEAQNADDLTFKAGANIENVNQSDKHWWRGDCGEKRQGWFPANRVRVITPTWPKKSCSEDSVHDYVELKFFSSEVIVKALYQYKAKDKNDLSFKAGAIITNVDKRDRKWWRGDYGGKHYGSFPANYVIEITPEKAATKEKSDKATTLHSTPQKGSIDLSGVVARLVEGIDAGAPRWVIQIQTPTMCSPFEIAAPSRKIALEWVVALQEEGESSSKSDHSMTKPPCVVVDMPDQTVHCSSFIFSKPRVGSKGCTFQGMSSFSKSKSVKEICQQGDTIVFKYHRMQFLCVNPSNSHSLSNYNPMRFWMSGSQMVALNYNLGDKPMQMNLAKFRENGGCGYVLKPDFMFKDDYDPSLTNSSEKEKRMSVMLRVIGGRHLSKLNESVVSPFVEVEIIGAERDNGTKLVTEAIAYNDSKLIWNTMSEFEISYLEGTIIRFLVQDKSPTGAPIFLGQATFPLKCLRTGYRSVPLCSAFSEEHELATLLVHLTITEIQF